MYTKFVSKQNDRPAKCPFPGTENGGNHVVTGNGNGQCPNKVDNNDNGISKCPIMSSMVDSLQKERQGNGIQPSEKSVNSDKSRTLDKSVNNGGCTNCTSCCRQKVAGKPPPVRSASGNYLSQEGSPCALPGRKTSNISNVSSSAGSDEADGEKKLDLRSLIEGIGTLLLPVVSKAFI